MCYLCKSKKLFTRRNVSSDDIHIMYCFELGSKVWVQYKTIKAMNDQIMDEVNASLLNQPSPVSIKTNVR